MSEATGKTTSGAHGTSGDRRALPERAEKHVHHGRTPAAWAGTMIALVAFFVGGIGLIMGPNWIVFWIAVGMVVVALVVTRILQVMGLGAK